MDFYGTERLASTKDLQDNGGYEGQMGVSGGMTEQAINIVSLPISDSRRGKHSVLRSGKERECNDDQKSCYVNKQEP